MSEGLRAEKREAIDRIHYYKGIKVFLQERHYLFPEESIDDMIRFCQESIWRLKLHREELRTAIIKLNHAEFTKKE